MKRRLLLDCTCLTKDSRHGERMFARLRYYYGSKHAAFNRSLDDKAVLMYAYVKYSQADPANAISIDRVERDYRAWLAGEQAPNYACSELRRALQDRDHRLLSLNHLQRFVVPITV